MYLLGSFKISVIGERVLILALVGCVFPADLGSGVINPASVIVLQVLTSRVDQQIPRWTLYKNRRAIVQQVPPHKIEIALGFGRVDRQCEIPTAFCRTMITQILSRCQLSAVKFQIGFSIHSR